MYELKVIARNDKENIGTIKGTQEHLTKSDSSFINVNFESLINEYTFIYEDNNFEHYLRRV
jgi:hypothetical protein